MMKHNMLWGRKKLLLAASLILLTLLLYFTFTYIMKPYQEKQFQTNLIAAACVGVKGTLKYPETAEFNNSNDGYVVSDKMSDDSYGITGYVTFMNKDRITQRKVFKVNLKYEPKEEKQYQIINVEIK